MDTAGGRDSGIEIGKKKAYTNTVIGKMKFMWPRNYTMEAEDKIVGFRKD